MTAISVPMTVVMPYPESHMQIIPHLAMMEMRVLQMMRALQEVAPQEHLSIAMTAISALPIAVMGQRVV